MRRARIVRSLLGVLTAALAGPARGETDLSIYIGKAFTQSSDVRLRQSGGTNLTFHGVDWDDQSFQMPIYYGARVTHFLKGDPAWGVALDFFHYKVYGDLHEVLPVTGARGGAPVSNRERLGDTFQKLAMSHGVNYLTLNGVHRWRLGRDREKGWSEARLTPYVGAGLGAVVPHVEITVGGRTVGDYQWHGPGYQVFGGVSYRLAKRWRLFGEYKFTHTTLSVDVPDGSVHTTLNTHHLVLGGSYRL